MIYILNKLFKQLYEINAERTPDRPCSLWPPQVSSEDPGAWEGGELSSFQQSGSD